MKEQEFIDVYREDMEKLHAPTDLIKKTKQMAAFEEKRYQKEKKRKYYFVAFATTAALLVICFSFFYLTRPIQQEEMKEQGTAILLGEHNEIEEPAGKEVEIRTTTILPMEFNNKDCVKENVNGTMVKITLWNGDCYMAAFEGIDGYIVVKSLSSEKEEFVEILEKVVAEYEE